MDIYQAAEKICIQNMIEPSHVKGIIIIIKPC